MLIPIKKNRLSVGLTSDAYRAGPQFMQGVAIQAANTPDVEQVDYSYNGMDSAIFNVDVSAGADVDVVVYKLLKIDGIETARRWDNTPIQLNYSYVDPRPLERMLSIIFDNCSPLPPHKDRRDAAVNLIKNHMACVEGVLYQENGDDAPTCNITVRHKDDLPFVQRQIRKLNVGEPLLCIP